MNSLTTTTDLPYPQLIQRLFQVNLFGGMKLGLENMLQLSKMLSSPEKQFPSIHVAGTNGKGSVSTKIAYGLQLAGYRVGLYTSPHIACFRERMTINGAMITEEEVTSLLNPLFKLVEQEKIPATFFELTTLLAFLYFSEKQVDFAIVETGLGGRLDATNSVTPLLSIITSIGLEHTEILGTTVEEIAREKGGIIKEKVPVLLGPTVPFEVIAPMAREKFAPCWQLKERFPDFDEENSHLAKKALEFLSKEKKFHLSSPIMKQALHIKPPCRLEIHTSSQLSSQKEQDSPVCFPPAVVLDAGHNPEGLSRLFDALQRRFPHQKFRVVYGLSKTKDLHACTAILAKNADHFHPVEAPNGRGASVADLAQLLHEFDIPESHISLFQSVAESFSEALKRGSQQGQVVIVCGTFFILNACREVLGIQEPRDEVDMNERQKIKFLKSHGNSY